MRSRTASLHPFLIILAVTLVSVIFVVSCGDGEATTAPVAAEATETAAQDDGAVAEETAAEETAQADTPKYGGTLTMAIVKNTGTLDPIYFLTIVDAAITQSTYDNLLMIQPDLTVKPELATSWEANDDLSSYTFHLRQGVKFHHGKEFKAEDVLFTFDRLQDPVLDSPARTIFQAVEDIVALDDYTVRFDLDGPNGFFLDSLSIELARIIPSDVDIDRLVLEEFGTGPFMLEEYLPGERAVMVRNPDYWEEGKPYLDEIVILLIAEAATRAEALKSGDVDIVVQLEPQSVPGIDAHPETTVLSNPSFSYIGLEMDNRVPPFDNKLVRQAMQAAADREAINQAALLGRGFVAGDHPVSSKDPRFASQYAPPAYDPDLARSLLEQAGYPDGIDVTLHTADVGAGMIEMAVAYKESAAPAGIRVDVQRGSPDGFWDEVWTVKPFTVVYWYGRPNPDQMLNEAYSIESVWNAARYNNPAFEELLVKGRGETIEEQKETYAEIQRTLIEDVPRLVLAWQPQMYGARTNVRGVQPHPAVWILVQDAWLDD